MRHDTARWLSPGDPETMAGSVASRFSGEFGRGPDGVWFAPGRANLNGEHIDFQGGRCLPLALPHGTYVAGAARTDGLLRIRTLDAELDTGIVEVSLKAVGPQGESADGGLPAWTGYVTGVAWALQQLENHGAALRLDPGFGADLLIRTTLPIGGGLSSSASLECAVAMACVGIGTAMGRENPGQELTDALQDAERAVIAAACMRAEQEVVGAGTGGLDQTTSMRAAEGRLLSLDCRDFSLQRVDLGFLLREHRLIAVDTGQPHELADGEFSARRAEADAACRLLGAQRMRELLPDAPRKADVELQVSRFDELTMDRAEIHGLVTARCRKRLQHGLTEMLRSERIHRLLTEEAHGVDHTAEAMGEAMSAGHTSMKEYAEVSFDLADRVVETALSAGALGARLIGGGFGGSVLTLVRKDDAAGMTAALSRLSEKIRFLEATPSPPAHAL